MKPFRLRQLQIIHRHGDRTPLINVFQGAGISELDERRRWEPLLPSADELARLKQKYVVQELFKMQQRNQSRPFGYLTTTGIQQMKARGLQLKEYCRQDEFDVDTIAKDDVQIFSNSYTRTQLSVQALLSAFFPENTQIAPPVCVLSPDRDMINTYAAFPEITDLKNALEKENAEFALRELEMTPRKAELMQLLPAFSINQPFTWMAAQDYFVCRRAHGIPYVPGTECHLEATIHHLSYRFHHFYSHRRILQLVAGRLMQNVLNEMHKAIAGYPETRKLVIYSGHDISLLAVIHTIDAELAQNTQWWPSYSSAISLELLEDTNGRWFVRARLDGHILAMQQISDAVYTSKDFYEIVSDRIGGIP